ncbi:hypothetical protein [Bifidobacterium sp.]|uniref:hypothetical protein n=1 Tax=Bifidobacterium sp. TaxID=41200 RepID=UPI0039E994ED
MTTSTASTPTLHRPRRRGKASWNSLAKPLEEWLRLIQSSSGDLGEDSIRTIDSAMKKSTALRDLLIISLLGKDDCRELDRIRTIFENPYAPNSVRVIRCNLEDAFAHPQDPEIRERCNRGLAILERAVRHVDRQKGASMLAIITYIRWWMGDKSAYAWAQACLKRDSSCTLASIILSALEHGMFPSESKD